VIKLDKSKFVFYTATIVFRVLLDISYFIVVSEVYKYQGFQLNFTSINYFLSWLIFLASFGFVKVRLTKVSDYFFVTALLSVVAPLTTIYGFDVERSLMPVLSVVASVYLIYLITRVKLISFRKIPTVFNGQRIALAISLLFVLFLLGWYYTSGVQFNLDLGKVYEFRRENAALAAGGILSYTNNWTYQIFNIFLMAFALLYRRYFLFGLLFLFQVYFFSASAHKSVLFLPILLFGIWYYFKKNNSLAILPIAFSLVILASLATYFVFDDLWVSSLFSRRVFFVPANLTFIYFEFFAGNPKIFWSNSVLSSFISYPYDISLAHVVGRYLGDDELGANNGFISSGYAHAGIFGIFIYTLIIGIILRFLNDITSRRLPVWLGVALTVVPLRALLISSDLFTVMLTHGFIVAIVLIYLARSRNEFS